MKKNRTLDLILLIFIAAVLGMAWGQENDGDNNNTGNLDDAFFGAQPSENQENSNSETNNASNDDALFGNSFVSEVEESGESAVDALLEQKTVTIGGKVNVDADLTALIDNQDENDILQNSSDLSSSLFIDARPSSTIRAFIKGKLDYNGNDKVDFSLKEMFVDTDIDKKIFLRAGKQTINWGVGYFFSPANLLNVERIDPENPGKELTGPVAIKVQYPIGSNNLTGYALTDDLGSDSKLGLAARYEFLLSGYEITTGARFQFGENPWAVMATAKGGIPLKSRNSSISVFAEAVLEGNLNKNYVVENEGKLTTEVSNALKFSATLGGRYTYVHNNDDNKTDFSLTVAAQYFFNGKGYNNFDLLEKYPGQVAALIASGQLEVSDLLERGQHYAAISIVSPDILKSDINANALWLSDLSDGSGFFDTSISYSGIKHNGVTYVTPSVSYRYNYGNENSEYAPQGGEHSVSVKVSFAIDGAF